MLEVSNLVKHYGKIKAVDDISFTVKPGEVFGFLGLNGAGKTTTIKVCTGLLKPTSGQVKVAGFDIMADSIKAKQNFGYVPDSPFIYDKLTPVEFLQFVGTVYMGKNDSLINARIDEMLAMFGLADRSRDLIESFSFGMKRKVSICAAMIHHPKVLLLDEPTTGMDAPSAKQAKDAFGRLAETGSAVVLTTHIMEIAERLCDRIGIINQGKIIAVGTLDELRSQASSDGSTLEDVFIALTANADSKADTKEILP